MPLEPARELASFFLVEHLCEYHADLEKAELEGGLGDFLEEIGFSLPPFFRRG